MLRIAELIRRLRRWKWIDFLITRIESYTALTEEYPIIKAVAKGAAAIVAMMWTYLAESWLPMALVAGLLTYIALGHLPPTDKAKVKSSTKGTPSQVAEEEAWRDELRMIRAESGLQLLFGASDDAFWIFEISRLIEGIPQKEGACATDGAIEERRQKIESYLARIEDTLKRSCWNYKLGFTLNSVEAQADADLNSLSIPSDHNPFIYRRYYIAERKLERVSEYLVSSLGQAKLQLRGSLSIAAKRLNASS